MNFYLVLIYTIFYLAVAMCIFVIMSVAYQGFIYIAKSLMYPLFVLGVIVLWCSVGQLVYDEVGYYLKRIMKMISYHLILHSPLN